MAWGHYNHSNISVSHKYTGAIVAVLGGIIVSQNLLGVSFFAYPTILTTVGIIFIAGVIGYFVLGPAMKYIFNSPEMHIWHHSYELPEERRYGINFGLTLSVWDYLFKTAYIPHNGQNIKLGFPGVDNFPSTFAGQVRLGFANKDFAAADHERITTE